MPGGPRRLYVRIDIRSGCGWPDTLLRDSDLRSRSSVLAGGIGNQSPRGKAARTPHLASSRRNRSSSYERARLSAEQEYCGMVLLWQWSR